jgi:hypothetical protein
MKEDSNIWRNISNLMKFLMATKNLSRLENNFLKFLFFNMFEYALKSKNLHNFFKKKKIENIFRKDNLIDREKTFFTNSQ